MATPRLAFMKNCVYEEEEKGYMKTFVIFLKGGFHNYFDTLMLGALL